MPLSVVSAAAEEVDFSMAEDAAEDMGEEVDKLEDYAAKEVMEELAAHMKMILTTHMSPITFNMSSGLHSLMIQ